MRLDRPGFALFLLASPLGCGGGASASPGSPDASPDASLDGDHPDGAGGGAPSDAALEAPVYAVTCTGQGGGQPYSKYKWAFAGNLHQHTVDSLDAYSFGTRVAPADAYEFAKGHGSVTLGSGSSAPAGPTVAIDRPLDFLALTDHSEWLGVVQACTDPSSPLYAGKTCAAVRSGSQAIEDAVFASLPKILDSLCGADAATCVAAQRTAWQEEQSAAAAANDPCQFTSFVAYEWTSMNGADTNHRNVFFATDAVPANPLDAYHFTTTADLFTGLDTQCTGGCQALVVPHNSNESDGTSLVLPGSAAELAQMTKYQRLVEVYQHKGSSECFLTDGGDPGCAFEYVARGDAGDVPQSYVRTALENGLSYAVANGSANPYEVGLVASTDDHNGTPGFVQESTYAGHVGRLDDQASLRLSTSPSFGSGGLAFVWAEQNTRDALFAALMRRETYGTSGPRLTVRFYLTSMPGACTADFPKTLIDQSAPVPMGGSASASALSGAPTFAVAAWPDALPQPLGDGTTGVAGIAAVQIVKAHAKAAAGGAAVVEDAPYAVSVPAMGGCAVWTDPAYDPTERAVYYVRVLQVPTWRWSHFDCQANPATAGCQAGGPLDVTVQERAWTSPIWISP